MSVLLECPVVQIDQRLEAGGLATDDGQHQGEPIAGGPDHRLGASPDSHPGGQVSLGERRAQVLVDQRRTELSRPGDRLIPQQEGQQVELLLEELLIVLEVVAEEWKRLGQGSTTDDELRSPVGHGVEGGELVVDPYRVLGAEHGHRGAQPDLLRPTGDGRQDHRSRRVHHVLAVVLGDVERVDADVVRQHGLIDDIANHLIARQFPSLFVHADGYERVQSELDVLGVHCSLLGLDVQPGLPVDDGWTRSVRWSGPRRHSTWRREPVRASDQPLRPRTPHAQARHRESPTSGCCRRRRAA